jgi:phenylalanyl-tRNA synthetase beta chain
MKLSRDWLSDFVDLTGISDELLAARMTEIGHAIEGIDRHGDDTVLDAEVTTNRIDAMSHFGMARELAAAFGRNLMPLASELADPAKGKDASRGSVRVSIHAPAMCRRYTALVIRGVTVKPSSEVIAQRLEAVGLRPINNVVDVTNYVMLALGHPLHAFDLARIEGRSIHVRAGLPGETMKSLDGAMRTITADTVVIADGRRAVALGGIIGGAESEISSSTRDVLLECAWFEPSAIRRTARRLGIRTDASYRFERRVDPDDTLAAIQYAADLIEHEAGGVREEPVDVIAGTSEPRRIVLRNDRLHEASAGAVGSGYALELFRRLGMAAESVGNGIAVTVPSYRGDIAEEMDLVEEVLRFYGIDKIPSSLPRLTTGDVRRNDMADAEDQARDVLAASGFTEVVTYSFIPATSNALFTDEPQLEISNALSENLAAMRLTLLPGLLETVVYNRGYGTRDGAFFEVGRIYRPAGGEGVGVEEAHRATLVLYGAVGSHWGDPKRQVDFFDAKGVVEQLARRFRADLQFEPSAFEWLQRGRQAVARVGDAMVATAGVLSSEVLSRFGIKAEILAAEIDLGVLAGTKSAWTIAPVSRYPGVPMVLGLLHSRELSYRRIVDAISSLAIPDLQEVGLRDRFVPDDNADEVKTTLGMWYQAFDRSLAQDDVAAAHQRLAARLAELLPVRVIGPAA